MKNNDSEPENQSNSRGLQLDPSLRPVDVSDDIHCSKTIDNDNLELWLLQLPLDFPLNETVVWNASQPGSRRVDATAGIEDAGYRLVEEDDLESKPVYAVGGTSLVRVTRRVSIVKQTDAPKLCFGIDDGEEEPGGGGNKIVSPTPTPKKSKEDKEKKQKKEKRKKRDHVEPTEPESVSIKKKSKKK